MHLISPMGPSEEVMVYSGTKTADQLVVTLQRFAISPQMYSSGSGGRVPVDGA